MSPRIVVDPLTRIEGHLKIEVETENGVVKDAWSSGTMARGWEVILRDRDPRDAPYITSRVCGVCEGVHTIASSQALDHACGIAVNEAGRLMRNLFCAGEYLHDHYIHFYILSALDYLDIMAVAEYHGNDASLLGLKEKIVNLVKKGDTSPFTPRYDPDEYSINDPETVITLVAHYIKAIEMKAKSNQILSYISGIQPHPNAFIVGGCTAIPSKEQMKDFRRLWEEQAQFVSTVYLPDVISLGTGPLLPLAKAGFGATEGRYLCYPMFPMGEPSMPSDYSFGGTNHLFKGGVVFNDDFNSVLSIDYEKITESVHNSWYNYPDGTERLHPSQGITEFNVKKKDAYSFIKAPRYDGFPMEVGPLARGMVNRYPELVNLFNMGGKPGVVARHLCRAVESKMIAEIGFLWIERLTEIAAAGPYSAARESEIPDKTMGMGVWDAPRGALGHWVEIDGKRIKNYQMVVPSTWNAGPRDEKGQRGPYEQALIGVPVPDPDNPINVVRVIRSFDPCLACAVHLVDPVSKDVKIFSVV